MRKLSSAALFAITILFFASCQKGIEDINTTPPDDSTGNPTPSADDLIKDTVLLICQDVYLWNTQIPANFNARSYASPVEEMEAIRQYSHETGFTDPVDRFSFAIKQDEWDNVSTGVAEDFGMSVFFNTPTDLRVKYAEVESPSGMAGIKRGWQIIKINGNPQIDTNETTINRIVDAVFYSESTNFTFKKPDGSETEITLHAGTYQTHPVFADSVYTVGSKQVGYLALNSFLGDTTAIYGEFARIFSNFQSKNVSEMIVDLRYNGGGYVSMAEKLANYLAPAASNNQVMYTETFNANYTDYNFTARFKKLGTVNVSKIYFIVSDNTASASELLINALKPFAEEKLVGPAYNTYGKPVGFFPIPVGDWYTFPISFKTVNKDGYGNYFNGFTIDHPTWDGLDKDWGDTDENCLHSVLHYIETGSFGFVDNDNGNISNSVVNRNVRAINKKIQSRTVFTGAVAKGNFLR